LKPTYSFVLLILILLSESSVETTVLWSRSQKKVKSTRTGIRKEINGREDRSEKMIRGRLKR